MAPSCRCTQVYLRLDLYFDCFASKLHFYHAMFAPEDKTAEAFHEVRNMRRVLAMSEVCACWTSPFSGVPLWCFVLRNGWCKVCHFHSWKTGLCGRRWCNVHLDALHEQWRLFDSFEEMQENTRLCLPQRKEWTLLRKDGRGVEQYSYAGILLPSSSRCSRDERQGFSPHGYQAWEYHVELCISRSNLVSRLKWVVLVLQRACHSWFDWQLYRFPRQGVLHTSLIWVLLV